MSVGGIHYLLNALIYKSFVKLGNFKAAENKRRYAHILTKRGIAEKTNIRRRFLAGKMEEYEALKAEIEMLTSEIDSDAGISFGRN